MQKNKKLGCIALLLCSPTVMAMQPLDDQSLAQTTGQDGINIGVGISKVQFNQLSIVDTDGLGSVPSSTAKASLVMAGKSASTLADQVFNVSFIGASSAPTMNLVFDADSGQGKPFANLSLGFGAGVTGIKVSPFAFYLAGSGTTSTPALMNSVFVGTFQKSDVNKFIKFDDGIDINFANAKPVLNVQMGNTPQGSLIRFGGAIQSICAAGNGCSISLLSDNSDVGASFKFQFKATDVSNGFSLNGFSAGVDTSGFTFGNTGASSKFDVALNQLTMGTNNATSATGAFNSLANGSMGNFGAVGASVTDLKMKVSGF